MLRDKAVRFSLGSRGENGIVSLIQYSNAPDNLINVIWKTFYLIQSLLFKNIL